MGLEKNNRLPEEKERDFTVRQHRIVYGIGILMTGAGVLLFVLELFYHIAAIPLWIYGIILAVIWLGVLVCLEAKNRQLAAVKDRLYYSSRFGRVKRFALEDIGRAKAASNPSVGRDYLRLYDKKGKVICRLETGMQNADYLIWYLHSNGIAVDMEKGTRQALADIVFQKPVLEKDLPVLSQEVYEQADRMIKEWGEKNRKLGAEFVYGFAEYYGSRIDSKVQIQPAESRIERKQQDMPFELPEDYICVLEVYIQKEGRFVCTRKGNFLMFVLDFPVFYKRKSGAVKEEIRLYYNENWKLDLEDALRLLVSYLPGHKFRLEQMELGYELKRKIG